MVMNCPGYSKEFDPSLIFRRILVPIDFSPASRHALITACETRARFGSDLHLFVATDAGHGSALRGLGINWGPDGAVHQAEEMLRYFSESICEGMPCIAGHATFGKDIVEGVAETARACGATMVILGTHDRHSPWRTRVERILNSLEIPVLVLKHTEALVGEQAPAATERSTAQPSA